MKVSNPEDESPPDDQRSSLKISDLDIPEGICQDFIDEGITELNPPQRDAVGAGLMDGEDMVVASPTASGKTFIAELAMVNQVKKEGKKAVYIVPLKALASEKYQDFSGRYSDLDVRMSVGDYDDSGTGLETADIIVATSEKLDSMLRHNPSWIHEIGLVVVDEIHLLTSPERGPTLEVTISRLRDIIGTGSSTESSAFQMLGLSATISNSDELADWLDAELVESDYRPVELKHGIYHGNEVEFYPEGVEKEDVGAGVEGSDLEPEEDSPFSTGNEVKDEEKDEIESHTYFVDDRHGRGTLNLIEDTLELDNSTESEDSARSSERGTGSSKQCIIFCSSRKGAEKSSDRATGPTGEDLSREERKQLADYADRIESVLGSPTSQCERLAENVREGAAFHHAGLLPEQRSLVEEAFREGLIRTVSATPTLAAGVNLPAFRVIIRDLKRYTGRGMEYIPVLEYEQMCLPYDQKIVLPDGRREEIGEIVENERKKEVLSYDSGIEPKEISEFFTRKSEVIEIETETGAFKLTENHPVLVKEEGDEIWVEAGNIDAGDAIKLADGFKTANNPFYYQLLPEKCYIKGVGEVLKDYKQKFDVTDDEMAEELDISESSVYHYRNDRKAVPIHGVLKACDELGKSKEEIAEIIDNAKSSYGNSIEIPEKLTEDFLWLLGIIVTDGNLNRTEDPRHGSAYTSIRVFNKDEEIIEKAESVFSTLSLDCYKEEREGKYRLEVGNTLLAELMNTVFDIPYGNKSQKTRIPEIIFGLPENLQASYLEGVYDGDGSYYKNEEEYKQRINFSTSSEKFANDLRELLAGFGIKSRLYSEHVEKLEINDTEYKVDKESYFLKIRNKDSVAKVSELIDPVKSDITVEEYSDYNNSNEHRKKATGYTEVLKINSRGEQKVYNIEVKDNENYITSSRAVLHNCGRAGRPKYDDRGEAISIAKSGDQDEILERYIAGEPERIQSKLNAEPILRMHTLSLVASRFCTSMPDLKEFYKKTFYA
ncbi:MAG: DEAD/DEAH box helicase, partial [Candidatus Nanohaloarchaea archaeon]